MVLRGCRHPVCKAFHKYRLRICLHKHLEMEKPQRQLVRHCDQLLVAIQEWLMDTILDGMTILQYRNSSSNSFNPTGTGYLYYLTQGPVHSGSARALLLFVAQ